MFFRLKMGSYSGEGQVRDLHIYGWNFWHHGHLSVMRIDSRKTRLGGTPYPDLKYVPSTPIYSLFLFLKAVYYLSGGFGLLWFILWMLVITDEPASHKLISDEERDYIKANSEQTIGQIGGRSPPYLKILTNSVVWVIMICDFANSISSYMVIIEGPNFISNVLKKDIGSVSRQEFLNFHFNTHPHTTFYYKHFLRMEDWVHCRTLPALPTLYSLGSLQT